MRGVMEDEHDPSRRGDWEARRDETMTVGKGHDCESEGVGLTS